MKVSVAVIFIDQDSTLSIRRADLSINMRGR
jgi:hypothetical protein